MGARIYIHNLRYRGDLCVREVSLKKLKGGYDMKKNLNGIFFVSLVVCAMISAEFTDASGLPIVSTLPASSITSTGAMFYGTVNPNGLATKAYFLSCEPASASNTFGQTPTLDLTGTTTVSKIDYGIAGLKPSTTYKYKIHASNSAGTKEGSCVAFTTLPAGSVPIATTLLATNITSTSATLKGTVTPNGLATKVNFSSCAASSSSPDYFPPTPKQDIGSGITAQSVTYAITGLKPNTAYKYAVKASNSAGEKTGSCVSFKTLEGGESPTVKTLPAADITSTSATLKISVNPNGLATQVWFTACAVPTDPTFFPNTPKKDAGNGTTTKTITYNLTGLKPGKVYKYQAWAQNSKGMKGGDCVSFTTLQAAVLPTVTTLAPTDITSSGARLKGTVNPNGSVTYYFFASCDSNSSPSFFMNTPILNIGSGTAAQTVTYTLTGLKPNTTYKYFLRGTNAGGIKDGSCVTFKTLASTTTGPPTVTTSSATGLTSSSAALQAAINPNGLATTLQFGSCDSVSSPTYFLPLPSPPLNAGSGTASKTMSYTLTGLKPGTRYNYQAIANNSAGLTKGTCKTFTTSPQSTTGPPTIKTLPATNITSTSVTLKAEVNPNGFATTAIFWSCDATSSPLYFKPTPAQSFPASTQVWSMTWSLTGLKPNTTYHYQAKGSNSAGDGIGACVAFTTPPAASPPPKINSMHPLPCGFEGVRAREEVII
jgi:hypothetical protein